MMSQTWITRNTPLLRSPLNGTLRMCTFQVKKEGPRQGLPMVGFCLPNEKESGMSQHAPSQFLLSG